MGLLVTLLCLLIPSVLLADAFRDVPNSISPDGKKKLVYCSPDKTKRRPAGFFVVDMAGRPLGSQLNSDNPDSINGLDLLFECIFNTVEGENGICSDFEFSIVWSADSRWLAVEGGAHKFWHAAFFHQKSSVFKPVRLPANEKLISFYRQHASGAPVKNLPPHPRDQSVIAVGPGVFAVLTYPYLVDEPDYEGGGLYFIIDLQRSEPKIIGFGK